MLSFSSIPNSKFAPVSLVFLLIIEISNNSAELKIAKISPSSTSLYLFEITSIF